MNFLEACRILRNFESGEELSFLLATSGTAEKIDIPLRAAGAEQGFEVKHRILPFNTLQQTLFEAPHDAEKELFVLFPWDLVPELDWRTGVPASQPVLNGLLEKAVRTLGTILNRQDAKAIYIKAPVMPLFGTTDTTEILELSLQLLCSEHGVHLLDGHYFSMGSHLDNGSPFSGMCMGELARIIIADVVDKPADSCKVLVTDLDNVMWDGVIGEDGLEGIHYDAQGRGYRFFIYQSFLKRLQQDGILLAAVSRNDEKTALSTFKQGHMLLGENDFIAIIASYNAKSAQIDQLAKNLNLGLQSFVFVDDNPVELEEVASKLPDVNCVRFPADDIGLAETLDTIAAYFGRTNITVEDKKRTEMYRSRLKSIVPSEIKGADLTSFLTDLEMKMTVHDRQSTDFDRAVQLINKTNQFNLNGIRYSEEKIAAILDQGGKLYTASMDDKNGVHGEVIACLIDSQGYVISFVMSCRIFQRKLEYAFLCWIISQHGFVTMSMNFRRTEKNEPFARFISDDAFTCENDSQVTVHLDTFMNEFSSTMNLFKVR